MYLSVPLNSLNLLGCLLTRQSEDNPKSQSLALTEALSEKTRMFSSLMSVSDEVGVRVSQT